MTCTVRFVDGPPSADHPLSAVALYESGDDMRILVDRQQLHQDPEGVLMELAAHGACVREARRVRLTAVA